LAPLGYVNTRLKITELGKDIGTVKVHLMHIFEKTGVKDRFELAVHGRRMLGDGHAGEVARVEASREMTAGIVGLKTAAG
jgi:hypothetical protein